MSAGFRVVETALGWIGLVGGHRGLRRVYLPQRGIRDLRECILADDPEAREEKALLGSLAVDLKDYFQGRAVRFDVAFDWNGATLFQRRVWHACARIPYGRTASYGELAARAGRPGASRAVGSAMGCNRCPIVVPCHRVLRSDGSIGGYSGPGGVEFKQQLLELERSGAVV